MKTYGRKVLYANIEEDTLLNLSIEEQNRRIIQILNEVLPLHNANTLECIYLKDFKKGIQDIYTDKKKITRPEIDNHTVENWAYAFIDFKKCFLLGKPIQYTQLNDGATKEIATLNKYCKYENKKQKDMEIYEDMLTCGRGFRYTYTDNPTDENEAPFEILNLDVEYTDIVYSSGIRKEQLFSFIEVPMKVDKQEIDIKTGELRNITNFYSEYTIYLRNRCFTVTSLDGLKVKPDTDKELPFNRHIIQEYSLNRDRISLIEIGKDLFNDVNYLESLDKDDMEQFVNAIMVFINAEVDENDLSEIRKMGAVSISSTENKEANVDLLEQRLNAEGTQIYYTRLLTSLHQILGIPMSSDSGTVTSGDTGQAKLTGQGYTMAGIRIEGDETTFDTFDKKCIELILAICKEVPDGEIKTLKSSDIEGKFSRDTSDNLLVKTQGLMNLYSCDIPREIANSVVNLFNDANAVTKMQEKIFGKQVSQTGSSKENKTNNQNKNTDDLNNNQSNNISDNINSVKTQNNAIQDINQKEIQQN